MRAVNLIGQRFGRLLVTAPAAAIGHGAARKTQWACRCDCGALLEVRTGHLKNGNTRSCGCLHVETSAAACVRRTKHGRARSPEYAAYHAMLQRCTNARHKSFADYGGRGIAVCARWQESFENFLADMGERPDGMSLDRIDNDRGYEPGNCRWATDAVQVQNRRSTRLDALSAVLVRQLAARRVSHANIARAFGIARQTVTGVATGGRWPHAVAALAEG